MNGARHRLIGAVLVAVACSPQATATAIPPELSAAPPTATESTVELPPAGKLYHGVYPGGVSGEEDDLTLDDLRSYEQAVGRAAAWVYFSHNWYRGREFPSATADWIRDTGSIPYVRLMLRSDAEQNHAEPVFTLESLALGEFDSDLRAWAAAARDFGTPIIAEFGTEGNGEWFPWNAAWNGGAQTDGYGSASESDGPERFRDAFRHIVELSRAEGAHNITWVFHANNQDIPDEPWNRLEDYYPGDEWVDWIGVSVYGAQTPLDEEWPAFREMMDQAYPRLAALSERNPIAVLEFAATSGNALGKQEDWAKNALSDLLAARWPRVIGFSWWNEAWQNDDDPAHNTNMRVQDNPALTAVFQELVGTDARVLGRPILSQSQVESPSTAAPTHTWWQPGPGTALQWQLDGSSVDTSLDVDAYDIDLFDNPAGTVAGLHAQGRKVICYMSAGTWEDWRPDAAEFPPEMLGRDVGGWPGERWLDIRKIDLLAPIMRARLDLCRAGGFDAVEADNVDGYTNETGFPLSARDQLNYNLWLADEAHARGLSAGLKNDPDQVADLVADFDWALVEDCFDQGWCDRMSPFIGAGKAVFAVEYTDTHMTLGDFCPVARDQGLSAMLKNRGLDAFRAACP